MLFVFRSGCNWSSRSLSLWCRSRGGYAFMSPCYKPSVSKEAPLLVCCHGGGTTIEQALFHFRESTQIVRNIIIPATAECPIKCPSEPFSCIGLEKCPPQVFGFFRDLLQCFRMCRPTGTAPSGGRSNRLGNLFGTSFYQIYQHSTSKEKSLISFSAEETNIYICERQGLFRFQRS
jgi:hypothetical protein